MKNYGEAGQQPVMTYEIMRAGDKFKVAIEEEFDSIDSAKKFCMDMGLKCNDVDEGDEVGDDTPDALKPTPAAKQKMAYHDKMAKGREGYDGGGIKVVIRP